MDDFTAGGPGTPPLGDLLSRVAGDATLMSAWMQVREADLDDGTLSRGAREFERHLLRNLADLKEQIADGRWQPGPVSRFALPADPARTITVSRVRDRVVERALAEVIGPEVDPSLSPFSFGYRRGLGVRDAVAALREALQAGWTHVARTDVAGAFDHVPRAAAVRALAGRVPDARVVAMVTRLLARLDDDGIDGIGIPQGSAVSPLMLNVYLDPADRVLLGRGLVPIRYADDYAVPASSAEAAEAAVALLADALDPLDLNLNPGKTRVVAAGDGVDFLGTRIGPPGTPAEPDTHTHPRRVVVYAVGAGAVARVRGRHVRVDRDGEAVAAMPLARVRTLVLGERVGVTRPLLDRAAEQGIDVVLVSQHGQFVGRLSRRRGGDVQVRRAQYRVADDPDRAMALAAAMTAAKIANMRVGIIRDARRPGAAGGGEARSRTAGMMERAAGHAACAISQAALMGVEGAATRAYFEWLGDAVGPTWGFAGRNRRPPRDPVNAMLSFAYTLLANEMVTACETAGLDPDLGYLHSPRWGRPSLALDLLEQWRPVLADTVVIGLARGRTVAPEDFTFDAERGCRMSAKARRAFLAAYEKRLLTPASFPAARGRHPYRELLAVQARTLADHLTDPQVPYQAYRWR